jgi:hypothetical protein
MITTEIRITEVERTALTRLLAKAKAEGVTITRDQDGRYFALSVSTPGKRYLVTGFSCECRGFITHGRCKHHAALLSAMGWLDDADPEPPRSGPAVAVIHIAGHWSTRGWLVCTRDIEWFAPTTTITIDNVDLVRVVGDSPDVRVHWLVGQNIVDNMTASTPSGLTHRGAAEHWLRALAASAPVDDLLYDSGIHEDRDYWDDLPDVDDVDFQEEVA